MSHTPVLCFTQLGFYIYILFFFYIVFIQLSTEQTAQLGAELFIVKVRSSSRLYFFSPLPLIILILSLFVYPHSNSST